MGARQLSADEWQTHVGTTQRAGRVTNSRGYDSPARDECVSHLGSTDRIAPIVRSACGAGVCGLALLARGIGPRRRCEAKRIFLDTLGCRRHGPRRGARCGREAAPAAPQKLCECSSGKCVSRARPHHRVENAQQLSHRGNDSDLSWFAGLNEASVEAL